MKISVCIPVYGVEAYVEKCARSLFEKAGGETEFVFVDDCSPDASTDVLKRVVSGFPGLASRVRIERHAENRGLAAARRTAMSVASGEWIAHCDSDDWIDPGYYEALVAAAESAGADMAYGDFVRALPDGTDEERPLADFRDGSEMVASACPDERFNAVWNKVIRRKIALSDLIETSSRISLGEDLVYTAQAVARCSRVVHVPGLLYHYRQNAASICSAEKGARRVESLCAVAEILGSRLADDRYVAMRDRLTRDILLAAIKYSAFDAKTYRAWRQRLASPLLSDARHGIGKKGILALAEVSYSLAGAVGRFFR